MGKLLRIGVPLNTLQNDQRTTTRSSSTNSGDDDDDFNHANAYFASRRTALSRMPFSAETIGYRTVFQQTQDRGYDDLLSVRKTSSSASENLRLEVPGFRVVEDLDPLRANPRLLEEDTSDEAYLKRHEKYEKQEKFIKRRDRIRQREEQYRLRLMKVEKSDAANSPKIESIEVVEKRPRRKH